MRNLALVIFFAGITAFIVFAAMGGLGSANSGDRDTGAKGTLTTEADFRDKLAEIKMNKDKLQRSIAKIEESRDKNLQFLKDQGITKVADAKGNPSAEIALVNLKAWTENIKSLTDQFGKYDSAISRIEGMLEKLERERINESVSLTEAQEVELRAIVMDLDDRLDIGNNDILKDAEMDDLLSKQLNPDKPN